MSAQNGRRVALGKRSGRGRKQGRGRGKGEWAGCAGGGRQGAGEAGRGCQDLQEGTALPASGLQPPECEETLSPAFSHLSQQPWGTKICPVQSVGWGHSLPPPWEHTHPPAPLLFQVHSMILGPVPRPCALGLIGAGVWSLFSSCWVSTVTTKKLCLQGMTGACCFLASSSPRTSFLWSSCASGDPFAPAWLGANTDHAGLLLKCQHEESHLPWFLCYRLTGEAVPG